MKKVLIGLGVLVLLAGGGMYYVFSNLGSIVEGVIERLGTRVIGSEVAVDRVEIHLKEGNVSIFGFSVANPEGFSNNSMMRFDELSVDLDVNNISSQSIGITSIVARNPHVRYESVGLSSNLDTVSARFASDETVPAESEPGSSPVLSIDSILVEGIQGDLSADLLPREVQVNLGNIELENLSGTPEQISRQVMGPVISQLSVRGANALLAVAREMYGQDLSIAAREQIEDLQDKADERLDRVGDELGMEIDEALVDKVKEGLGDLLNR